MNVGLPEKEIRWHTSVALADGGLSGGRGMRSNSVGSCDNRKERSNDGKLGEHCGVWDTWLVRGICWTEDLGDNNVRFYALSTTRCASFCEVMSVLTRDPTASVRDSMQVVDTPDVD